MTTTSATVTIGTAKKLLRESIKEDNPLMLWGDPGIGKTSICSQLASELKMGFRTFNAVTHNPVDLMGMPHANMKTMTTDWLRPSDLPDVKRDGETGIWLLDDIVNAPQMMQAACFQAIEERRVGDHVIPPGWIPVGAGNYMKNRSGVQRMPSALANRFGHIDIVADKQAACDYWSLNGYDPFFVAFFGLRKEFVHAMPTDPDVRAYPTPRSWSKAHKYLNRPRELRVHLVGSQVGYAAATELEGFLRICHSLPAIADIFNDPDNAKIPADNEPAAKYALVGLCCREANPKTFAAVIKYLGRLGREYEVAGVLDACHRNPNLMQTGAYSQWAVRNQDIIIDAADYGTTDTSRRLKKGAKAA